MPDNDAMARRLWYFVVVCIGIGLLAVHSAGTSRADNFPTEASSGTYPRRLLKFGVMADVLRGINSKDAMVVIKLNWISHLTQVFHEFEAHFEVLPDIATVVQRIQNRRLHGFTMGVGHYLRLRDQVELTPVFCSSNSSSPLESYLLLVHKDTNWQRLSTQPRRRLMTETVDDSHIGHMWLETVLNERQLPLSATFFTEITSATKPARAILPVFFGQADACLALESAYQTMVELNPQVSKQLTVLARSPGFIKTIHCATNMLSKNIIDRFIKECIDMEKTAHGRQLLLIFREKKTFIIKPEHLVPSETIFHNYLKIMPQ
jgi:ABC-type phosphate/phosphonate transport system substrate-binding protein